MQVQLVVQQILVQVLERLPIFLGEEDLAQMDAAQLEKVTQGIMSDFTEGGHARSMEDADNPDIEGEFDPHLFYGEVNLG